MSRKQTILFLFSIAVLIISEYFLLNELCNNSRLYILLICLAGTVTGVLPIIKIFKSYRSGTKEL